METYLAVAALYFSAALVEAGVAAVFFRLNGIRMRLLAFAVLSSLLSLVAFSPLSGALSGAVPDEYLRTAVFWVACIFFQGAFIYAASLKEIGGRNSLLCASFMKLASASMLWAFFFLSAP